MKYKKGSEYLQDNVLLIVVMILLFSGIIYFVHKSSTGAVVYEELYAKEISLIIEKAKPDSEIIMDFSQGFELAEENNIEDFSELIDIDNNENRVFVRLSSRGGYYSYYFSDYDISISPIKEEESILISIE